MLRRSFAVVVASRLWPDLACPIVLRLRGKIFNVMVKLGLELADRRTVYERRLQLGHAKWFSCSAHVVRNISSTRANVTSGPCSPSRIASTMSGASSVRRRMRVM